LHFRPLTCDDVPAISALEAAAYLPSLHESAEAIVRLIALYPDGAIGAFDEEGLCGFILGVPLTRGMTLDLRVPLAAILPGADTFYVHDLAVAERCRGRSIGSELARRLLATARARGFSRAELVSVQGSARFWEACGFHAVRTFDYVAGAPSMQMEAMLTADGTD
jgi:ribosomal protein S18 acetylase RimI-like enzyme